MRITSLAFVLLAAIMLTAPAPAAPADIGSFSRDALGPQRERTQDPLGGPPTPTVLGIGQSVIFYSMAGLLIAAACLGVYTLVTARPIDEQG
jgi:hypothetical protein